MVRYDPEQLYMLAKPIEVEYSELDEYMFLLLLSELLKQPSENYEEWLVEKRTQLPKFTSKVQAQINRTTEKVAKKLQTTLNAVEKETQRQASVDLKSVRSILSDKKVFKSNYAGGNLNGLNTPLNEFNKQAIIRRVEQVVSQLNGSMLNQMQSTYTQQIENVYHELSTNQLTVEQAVNKSMKPVAKSGIKGFKDSSGRMWQSDVYMRTVMRNNIKMFHNSERLNSFINEGITLVVVSEHAGSRLSHFDFQNKVYSLVYGSDYPHISETGIGEPAGLLGINCRHFLMAYIEGMEIQEGQYTAEENEKMYEYLQQQRGYERAIRELKRQAELAKQTGEDELYSTYKRRSRELGSELNQMIKKANAEYDDFLRRQRDREMAF